MPGRSRAQPAGGPSLFDPPGLGETPEASAPLAVRMRPRDLSELVGQEDLVAPGSPLRRLVEGVGAPTSVILWGPPGTGKTTIASLVSKAADRSFVELSAVTAGVKDVRAAIEAARMAARPTVLFIDEVHRFTRTQQDALLPGVENGWVTLVAATTENPSFAITSPLLSRSLLLTLRPLGDSEIGALLDRAVADARGLGGSVVLRPDARADLVRFAGGDARRALTYLEVAAGAALDEARATAALARPTHVSRQEGVRAEAEPRGGSAAPADDRRHGSAPESGSTTSTTESATTPSREAGATIEGTGPGSTVPSMEPGATSGRSGSAPTTPSRDPGATVDETRPGSTTITAEHVASAVQRALVRYDRTGDQHYDVISAFIKSVRGSDVDAALHYLARMIEAGEDPRFIARRLVILASEDVGLADPTALGVATAAMTAAAQIGLPEARLPLAQATIHLSLAPKSNAVIRAIDGAAADVRAGRVGQVPVHLRDAHYPGAVRHGVTGYVYPHDQPGGVIAQQHAPDPIVGRTYYHPTDRGAEERISDLVHRLRSILRPGSQD